MSLDTSYLPNNNRSKHIFLIDDDESMRISLKGILEFLGYQVNVFESAVEFLKIKIEVAPAVIITDMRMPDINGLELQAELLKRGRQIPIIFISGQSTFPQTISAMKQGAIEFLIKPFDRDQILSAVERGLEQDEAYMQSFTQRLTLEEMLKSLSPREREVFELLAIGFNNAQLQEKLQIALPTAKQYKSEVMRKLNLSSLAELISLKNRGVG
ncbi:response regulator transcription factor [Polynucleobacter rarus]|uniref:response regulator transcription factor n=1 Tax=Polynucleobacter rarus TaxID=556055 RepID=UPI000D3E5520|nr:response regulator [Polynucleobacter rarus]